MKPYSIILITFFLFDVGLANAITVNVNNDNSNTSPSVSLRDAIIYVNTYGGDIDFNLIQDEIILSSSLPQITNSSTIDGTNLATGNKIKINGAGIFSILTVNYQGAYNSLIVLKNFILYNTSSPIKVVNSTYVSIENCNIYTGISNEASFPKSYLISCYNSDNLTIKNNFLGTNDNSDLNLSLHATAIYIEYKPANTDCSLVPDDNGNYTSANGKGWYCTGNNLIQANTIDQNGSLYPAILIKSNHTSVSNDNTFSNLSGINGKSYAIKLENVSSDNGACVRTGNCNYTKPIVSSYSPAYGSSCTINGTTNKYTDLITVYAFLSGKLRYIGRTSPTGTGNNWSLSNVTINTGETIYATAECHIYNSFSINSTGGNQTNSVLPQTCNGNCCDWNTSELMVPIILKGRDDDFTLDNGTDCKTCYGSFTPIQGKKYLLSAWAKENTTSGTRVTNYSRAKIQISFPNIYVTLPSFTTKGNIIDGWQRIEGLFEVPAGATQIKIDLINLGGLDIYYDDVRIHPFDANMKSFVYDVSNFRLMSELDDNNYATYYEYDAEGNLIRVKKETEKGIVTVKESKKSILKK